MLFNSFSFALFLPIVFGVYYALPARHRNLFLLLASCFFYMSFVPHYILILGALITVDFFLAQAIHTQEGYKRTAMVTISIVANLGTLLFFRYFNFFNENIASLASFLHWNYSPLLLQIALPLGLSFHIFQSLSYVIEVYKKKYTPETNYLTYALYVMFFPQLVAGPIERPQHLLPQLNQVHTFDPVLARKGLERMLWGFFKKLVIADQIAQIINPLYHTIPQDSTLLIIMVVLFSYQLYCDFSGYSDIALGAAMMFGYDLSENFNRPFSSKTFAEFWRRWHISLSNWLRDYLYYPLALGWGKVSKVKLYISLLITFFLIGLWHGPNWTFAVFGVLNGMYLVIETATEKMRKRVVAVFGLHSVPVLHKAIQTLIVFTGMTISFIFFRSETITQAITILKSIGSVDNMNTTVSYLIHTLTKPVGTVVFLVVIGSILILEGVQYLQTKKNTFYIFDLLPNVYRYMWYYALVVGIIMFGYFGAQTFIYFQF